MAKIDLVESLQVTIDTVQDALDKGAEKAAFFCALSIPDICAQIEYSNSKLKNMDTGERYSKWYNKNLYYSENPPGQFPMNQLDGDVAYLIRCKLYHEGEPLHKKAIEKMEENYKLLISEDQLLISGEINVNVKFVSENCERFSMKYDVDRDNHPTGTIVINVYVNRVMLAQKLLWIANGVIENFKKNNPASD